jgi:hypothetical protein
MNLLQTMQVPVKLALLVASFCFPAWNGVVESCQWLAGSWGGHGNKTMKVRDETESSRRLDCSDNPSIMWSHTRTGTQKTHSTTLTRFYRLNTKYSMR